MAPEVKVFWFFSSEKNTLPSDFLHRRRRTRQNGRSPKKRHPAPKLC
jgi:hypothetical protein